MRVTVTLACGAAVELEGTEAEVDRWERAVQGKQRTFKGATLDGGSMLVVCELVAAMKRQPEQATPRARQGRR